MDRAGLSWHLMNSRIQRVGQNQIAGLSTNKDAAGKSRSILKSSVSGLLGKDVRSFWWRTIEQFLLVWGKVQSELNKLESWHELANIYNHVCIYIYTHIYISIQFSLGDGLYICGQLGKAFWPAGAYIGPGVAGADLHYQVLNLSVCCRSSKDNPGRLLRHRKKEKDCSRKPRDMRTRIANVINCRYLSAWCLKGPADLRR